MLSTCTLIPVTTPLKLFNILSAEFNLELAEFKSFAICSVTAPVISAFSSSVNAALAQLECNAKLEKLPQLPLCFLRLASNS
jgi:hypothetical protein